MMPLELERSPLHVMLFIVSILAAAATERVPNATCPSYRCGHAVDIRYPFWIDDGNGNGNSSSSSSSHYCGYPTLRLECRRDTPVLRLPSGDYAVTHILYGGRTVSLFDLGVFSLSNTCPLVGRNLTLPAGSPLSLTPRDANLTFFLHCSFVGIPAHLVACLEGDGRHHSYVFRDGDELAPPPGYAGLVRVPLPGRRRNARAAEVAARRRRRRRGNQQEPAGRRRAGAQHGVRAQLEAGDGGGVRPVREGRRRALRPTAWGGGGDVDLRLLPGCADACVDCSKISK
ncbi:unnamed protein product [Urochloa humidicola]